ncbi:hypothetical protein GGS20DRAFT_596282 [Poronia punctata]|nr:hypothetical protein GGS20DRAFT_596282 [Poronia punctata]
MAVPGTGQALIAAFFFGILFNAASAALVLNTKAYVSAIFTEGLRLALVLFLFSCLVWAFVGFLSTLIEPSATSTCQVAVVFSSLFDQFSRTFVEQYLTWAVRKGETNTRLSVLPQILVFARFFVGIGLTALTRAQFKPTCVPVASIQGVAVSTIVLDAVIIGLLSIKAFSNEPAIKDTLPKVLAPRIKTARLIIVGVALWWGTSVTSTLALQSIDLFYRTALPGIGLSILTGLVTVLSPTLTSPREPPQRPDSPLSRDIRDLPSSNSSHYTNYPPSRYEDVKGVNSVSMSAFVTEKEANQDINRSGDGTFPTNSRSMTARLDIATVANPYSLSKPEPRSKDNFLGADTYNSTQARAKARAKATPRSKGKLGKLVISRPILYEDRSPQNPLSRINTISLAEAANNERIRRERSARCVPNLIAQRPAPRPPSQPPGPEVLAAILRRETIDELQRSGSAESNESTSRLSVVANASSTATQLSPGVEAIRRRSPREPESDCLDAPFRMVRPGEPIRVPIRRPSENVQAMVNFSSKREQVETQLQRRATTGLPSRPRDQTRKTLARENGGQDSQTVMFVNNIVYDDPSAVGEILHGGPRIPQPLDSGDSGDSVLNRPRPIPRKGDKDRQVFPAEISPSHHHKKSKSGSTLVSWKSELHLAPGSPTRLPSLPPIPPMAAIPSTVPRPNRTESMTVEEKMVRLCPPPLPEIPFGVSVDVPFPPTEVKRRSSPILPDDARPTSVSTIRSGTRSSGEVTVSNWGSVHSPVVPVARQNARSTYIGGEPRNDVVFDNIPIVMMDTSATMCDEPQQSSDSESDKSLSSRSGKSPRLAGQFHRRVGDECPTFSTRTDKVRPRKVPPPTPLLLRRHTAKRAIVLRVQPTEPSPIESPTAAYEALQAQLRNIERPPLNSVESPGRRLALLANLEQEMGQLETQWLSTHDQLGRDSLSSMPSQASRPTSIGLDSSRRSSITATIAERRASANIDKQLGKFEDKNTSRKSWQSAQNGQVDLLNPPSMGAYTQTSGNSLKLLARTKDHNILSVPRSMLRSPSPPETEGSDWDVESRGQEAPEDEIYVSVASSPSLWRQTITNHSQTTVVSRLWSPGYNTKRIGTESHESMTMGISLRRRRRKYMEQPLTIESSHLWKPSSKPTWGLSEGALWNGRFLPRQTSSSTTVVRRATLRPPRRSKRISVLPDIIENPQPLPDKRGTLGIFQFPWGERSEHPTMQYRRSPSQVWMAMPGTMTSGRSEVTLSAETQPEVTEYSSSSFFDEYDDDDDEEDNFSDFSDSGDDFDETTLWEIASLLKTDQVPSKNSLLLSNSSPRMDSSIPAEYTRDIPSDYEHEDEFMADIPIGFDSTQVAIDRDVPEEVPGTFLWRREHASRDNPRVFGLNQDESFSWALRASESMSRVKRKKKLPTNNDDVVFTRNDGLWSPAVVKQSVRSEASLWTPSSVTIEVRPRPRPTISVRDTGLWSKYRFSEHSITCGSTSNFGLPEPNRSLWQKLVSLNGGANRSRSRIEVALPTIYSSKLWDMSTVLPLVDDSPVTECGLWEPAAWDLRIGQTISKPASSSTHTSSYGLWQYVARAKDTESRGLFDAQATRYDFRRTSQPLIGICIYNSAKARYPREPLPSLASCYLWIAGDVQFVINGSREKVTLWTRKSISGLFTERRDYNNTSAT